MLVLVLVLVLVVLVPVPELFDVGGDKRHEGLAPRPPLSLKRSVRRLRELSRRHEASERALRGGVGEASMSVLSPPSSLTWQQLGRGDVVMAGGGRVHTGR
ncbi:hypothetical protein FIBSPDRAFT_905275 [Athelia psychrophila]|uniref:Secreted protein n=1 Tax=Athelia psychrophila TaxID=1759441 RepID=A0A167TMN7_9AGAM|nr:hypothetical protein FIBSPDRAFT_905275 [Fibularhizoctonia sp. CBS 109695]